jgi:integrase/recombinase XerD
MNEYLNDLKAQNVRTTTHKSSLNKFFAWERDRGFDFLRLRVSEAHDFQLQLVTKTDETGQARYSAVTVSTIVDQVRRFYDYLRKRKLIHTNPFREIQTIKRKKSLPRNILNEEDMSRLLRVFREFWKGERLNERRRLYRAHVISEFMYATGARINEVMKIKRDDIDFIRNTVTVFDDKTKKGRECILNEYAAKVVRIFVDEMREHVFNATRNRGKDAALFGAARSLVIWLKDILNKESGKLGLGRFTSHGFRHALGFHLLRAGCDIRFIKEILGHEELGTTQIYTKVDKLDLKNVIDVFHPRQLNVKTELANEHNEKL